MDGKVRARELTDAEVAEAWEITLDGFHDDEWGHSEEGGWIGLVGESIICQISSGMKFGWRFDSKEDAEAVFGRLVAAYEIEDAVVNAEFLL